VSLASGPSSRNLVRADDPIRIDAEPYRGTRSSVDALRRAVARPFTYLRFALDLYFSP